MRKTDFKTNHNEFEKWIVWYGAFMKKLIEAQRVIRSNHEKMELIEALVLRCFVRWEVLVEDDIIVSLNRDPSTYANALGLKLRRHLSRDESEAIVVGHRYLDFKSVDQIKNFAKKYLTGKFNPFQAIPRDVAEKIDQFAIMRNLLSHYSSFAWRSYRKMMAKYHSYKRIPEPGAYLIKTNRKTGEYHWSEYLTNFLRCSELMRKAVC